MDVPAKRWGVWYKGIKGVEMPGWCTGGPGLEDDEPAVFDTREQAERRLREQAACGPCEDYEVRGYTQEPERWAVVWTDAQDEVTEHTELLDSEAEARAFFRNSASCCDTCRRTTTLYRLVPVPVEGE